MRDSSGDQETVARWEDPLYRLEVPVQAATVEAKRLDDLEAPQREAKAMAERDAKTATLEKARLLNKPKFRP